MRRALQPQSSLLYLIKGTFSRLMAIDSSVMETLEEDTLLAEDSDEGNSELSDGELQEAFAKGLLKAGMNVLVDEPKKSINNVEGMKHCLADLRKDLPWVERLDMTNPPAADIITKVEGKNPAVTNGELNADNDFQREMFFYRQAQATVLDALPLLKQHDISTKRPDDYFAEMAKSDQQMQKIRKKLLAKQMILERSEKAKKLREQRKFGKKVQIEVIQKRQKEKKAMMSAVKKYQKGMTDKLDFLEGDKGKAAPENPKKVNKNNPNAKRKYKDQRFGFGGKKSGKKWNTKDSHNDVSSFRAKVANSRPGMGGKKGKGGKQNKRPGKAARRKTKSRS